METPSIAELPRHLSDRGRTIWVDLENPTDEETGVLGGMFGFHILTVEDCMGDAWLPKEDIYDGYTYSVFYAAAPNKLDGLVAQKLDIFVGPNFLVTYHADEVKGIFDTRGIVAKNPGSLLRSSDWLLHGILNTVIDFCNPAMEGLEARIDRIAEAASNGLGGLEDAIELNRDLRLFRDITANQQGLLERLGYSNESYVSEDNRDYFRDVHDHNRHLYHRAVQGLEKLAWVLDTVRGSDSRRTQNAVRWGVALATAFLLPLLVVSSLSLPPEVFALSGQVPTVVIGVVVAYVIGVLLIFKQKRWF
jgi:magnesium transporter